MKTMKRNFTLGIMMLFASYVVAQSPLTIDFEDDGVGSNWEWWSGSNGGYEVALEVVDNPDAFGINLSDKVGTFTATVGGDPWANFMSANYGDFTFTASNCIVKLMVYKSVISGVDFKVDGGTGTTTSIYSANTKVNEWEELTFDFTDLIGQTYSTFIITPDNTGEGAARAEDRIIYVDNLQVPNNDTVTSINSIKEDKLLVYPNPVKDFVNVPNVPNGASVNVYSLTGALVKSAVVSNGILSLRDLNQGMYFIKSDGASVKIIKK